MLWLPIVALVLIAIFTVNRKLFAIGFMALFVAVAGVRLVGDIQIATGFDFEGDDVIQNTQSCGSAVGLLLLDASDDLRPNAARECEKSARTRVVEALGALVVGVGGSAAGWVLIPRLRPTPIDEVLNPLPESADKHVTGRPRSERMKRG